MFVSFLVAAIALCHQRSRALPKININKYIEFLAQDCLSDLSVVCSFCNQINTRQRSSVGWDVKLVQAKLLTFGSIPQLKIEKEVQRFVVHLWKK